MTKAICIGKNNKDIKTVYITNYYVELVDKECIHVSSVGGGVVCLMFDKTIIDGFRFESVYALIDYVKYVVTNDVDAIQNRSLEHVVNSDLETEILNSNLVFKKIGRLKKIRIKYNWLQRLINWVKRIFKRKNEFRTI